MLRLAQGFTVQQILLVKIDLGQVVMTILDFDPAGRAGGIASAIVIQAKTQDFRGFQERRIEFHLPTPLVEI